MTTISVSQARANLYKLLDEIADSHEAIQITGKRHNAILITEEDWRGIEATLHLKSIPGLSDSIKKGMSTPLEQCQQELKW